MKLLDGKKVIGWVDNYLYDPRLDSEAQLRKRWVWIWYVVTFVFVGIEAIVSFFVFKLWPLWWAAAVFFIGYAIGFPLFRRAKRFDLVFNILFIVFITVDMFAHVTSWGAYHFDGLCFQWHKRRHGIDTDRQSALDHWYVCMVLYHHSYRRNLSIFANNS